MAFNDSQAGFIGYGGILGVQQEDAVDATSASSEEHDSAARESYNSTGGVYADKISSSAEEEYTGVHVPKYFQAIFSLFVCFFLLFFTLAFIQQCRRLCRKKSSTNKIPLIELPPEQDANIEVVTPEESKPVNSATAEPNWVKLGQRKKSDGTPQQDLLKLKKVRFVRRASGPFAEDALDFVGETYKNKYVEKEMPQKMGGVSSSLQQSIKKHSHHHSKP